MFDQERGDRAASTLKDVHSRLMYLAPTREIVSGITAQDLSTAIIDILENHETYVLVSKSAAGRRERGLEDLAKMIGDLRTSLNHLCHDDIIRKMESIYCERCGRQITLECKVGNETTAPAEGAVWTVGKFALCGDCAKENVHV